VLIGNLVKYDEDYRILLLVDGQWTDIGIACATYMEAMDLADRSLDRLFVNLPISESSHLPRSEAA
jgi:hypothetical protein